MVAERYRFGRISGHTLPGMGSRMGDEFAESLNKMVMRVAVRAEMTPESIATATFVSIREVTDSLMRIDHQVVYGRRGAGKTHAFRNLQAELQAEGDLAVYIDLRTIGSNGGMYGDNTLSIGERGTQLLIDVLEKIHNSMLTAALEEKSFEDLLPHLDAIGDSASQVRVDGPVSLSLEDSGSSSSTAGKDGSIGIGLNGAGLTGKFGRKRNKQTNRIIEKKQKREVSGKEVPRIMFGQIGKALQDAVSAISPLRVWVLLDEWSSLPVELQPILADLIRRAVFPVNGFTFKIAAIERRSLFAQRSGGGGGYLGIELGSDTASAINLDDRLADEGTRSSFFAELLYRHLSALLSQKYGKSLVFENSRSLVLSMFDSVAAFEEFVKSAEGVPRDALQIASHAASQAGKKKISVADIKYAARRFYLQDKEAGISGNSLAEHTMRKLMSQVAEQHRSRTFLVKRDRVNLSNGLLDLHDARLIHLMQPGIFNRRNPGFLYDGYCLDYGSYVALLQDFELAHVWSTNGRPWRLIDNQALLPDDFESTFIFDPPLKVPKAK